jgi:hypothetical protein
MNTPYTVNQIKKKIAPDAIAAATDETGNFTAVLPTGEKKKWTAEQVTDAMQNKTPDKKRTRTRTRTKQKSQ